MSTSSRDELRAWLLAHSRDDADARVGSSLVARFVSDAVRLDRRKRNHVPSEPGEFVRAIDTFFNGRPAR